MHLVLAGGLSGCDMGNTNLKWSLCGHVLFSSTENSVTRVQGSLNLTFAYTGKFGQIVCYMCEVVRMVHEQHAAACSGQRVKWSRYGQYQFEIGIVRARTVRFNLEKRLFACKGA